MSTERIDSDQKIYAASPAFFESRRGLIAVWGKEAVQFLDGMITNDMKTLADGSQMLAAFPNAQGRLLAIVRVLRQGEKYLIETEATTRAKVFNNLFRFTFAGDFFVEDLSDDHSSFEVFGPEAPSGNGAVRFSSGLPEAIFVRNSEREGLLAGLRSAGFEQIHEDAYETLRVEAGIPKYGVDMDDTTVVPELGIDGLISYNKGCYIGQEIIARIHFRGHVAKRIAGLVSADADDISTGVLTTAEGREAGRVTSTAHSPKLGRAVAIGLVRYDYLTEGTELLKDGRKLRVTRLPFRA